MWESSTRTSMMLNQDKAQKLLAKVLDRSVPVLEAGTPEEIHHITSAIKDVLSVMSTEQTDKTIAAPELEEK